MDAPSTPFACQDAHRVHANRVHFDQPADPVAETSNAYTPLDRCGLEPEERPLLSGAVKFQQNVAADQQYSMGLTYRTWNRPAEKMLFPKRNQAA